MTLQKAIRARQGTCAFGYLKAYDMLVCRILQNCKTVITDRLKKSTYNFIRNHYYYPRFVMAAVLWGVLKGLAP